MATTTTDLLSLPQELLIMVVVATDHNDLLSLRLTCKKLESASRDTFALQFFTNRRIVVLENSVKALSDITKHEFFASYLDTISINSAAVSPLSQNTDQHYQLLQQAFHNVTARGNQMSLCIFDAIDSSDLQKTHGFERLHAIPPSKAWSCAPSAQRSSILRWRPPPWRRSL